MPGADVFEPVRRTGERRQRSGDRVGAGQPGLDHERRGRECVRQVVGQAAFHRTNRSDGAVRADQPRAVRALLDAVVGRGGAEGHRPSRRLTEATHDHRVVDEADGDVVRPLVGPHLGLGGFVGGHRAMPVEMIRCEVEPGGTLGTERRRPRKSEAGAFDDEGVEVELDRVDQRGRGVPCVDRAQPASAQHLDSEQGRGRLAVGAGDREHRSRSPRTVLLPSVGEFDLRHQFDAGGLRDADDGVGLGNAWRRTDQVARRHHVRQRCGIGTVEQLDAQFGGEQSTPFVDDVVGDDHVDATTQQCAHRRLAGDRQAVDERSTHDRTVTVAPGR